MSSRWISWMSGWLQTWHQEGWWDQEKEIHIYPCCWCCCNNRGFRTDSLILVFLWNQTPFDKKMLAQHCSGSPTHPWPYSNSLQLLSSEKCCNRDAKRTWEPFGAAFLTVRIVWCLSRTASTSGRDWRLGWIWMRDVNDDIARSSWE